MGTLRCKANGR